MKIKCLCLKCAHLNILRYFYFKRINLRNLNQKSLVLIYVIHKNFLKFPSPQSCIYFFSCRNHMPSPAAKSALHRYKCVYDRKSKSQQDHQKDDHHQQDSVRKQVHTKETWAPMPHLHSGYLGEVSTSIQGEFRIMYCYRAF